MRGLLFYDEIGAKRNEWFIKRLTESARSRGCDLELIVTDDFDCKLTKNVDFAILRTISPKLSERIEKANIPCFNNSRTSRIANDKWQTYLFSKEHGIAVMKTFDTIDEELDIPFPLVMKSVDGHGGSEVFLVQNTKECKQILSKFRNKRFIYQELSSEPGIDMRVYVLGSKVLAAVTRTSVSDFRSNFSLGGNAHITELPNELSETVDLISRTLCSDLIGIDFIRHNRKWVLNEIEDVVGTRMLYALTNIDAAQMYVDHILSKLNI